MKPTACWTALCAALLLTTTPASAAPVTVNVRVEGSDATYFEGPVTTDAHDVQGHPCTPPGDAAPSPTMITALDDAAATKAIFWSGTWYDSFGDFFVDEIGTDLDGKRTSDKGGTTTYWVLARNFEASPSGGCQTAIKDGDRLLFAFGSELRPMLELSGVPARAAVGEGFDVLVSQHANNQAKPDGVDSPAPGASVEGQVAGADGIAHLSFATPGLKRFKATREGSVRSNAGQVCVYAPGSGDCGTGPASAPVPPPPTAGGAPAVETPRTTVAFTDVRDGRTYRASRAPRRLSGSATGAGVDTVELRVRRQLHGRCWFLSPRSRRFVRSPSCGKDGWLTLTVSDGRWTLRLPQRLVAARYTAQIRTGDTSAVVHFRVT